MMNPAIEISTPECARTQLATIMDAAKHLAPPVQSKFLLSGVSKAERCAAMHDRCLLDRKFEIARDLWLHMRNIGAVCTESDVLYAWVMTEGAFESRFNTFLEKLSLTTGHQKILASEHISDLQPLLEDLSRQEEAVSQNRMQGAILHYAKTSLRRLVRYQEQFANGCEAKKDQIQELIIRLNYCFPGLDWSSHLHYLRSSN
jgi:hypothetical protein